jgi:hypothetical protein
LPIHATGRQRFCAAILRHSVGLEALPGADALARWLNDSCRSFRPVLASPIDELTLEIIPFGVADHAIARLSAEARPAEAEAAWREIADARGIDVGVGPWGEVRTVYTSDMFLSTLIDGARRTVHLGLDLFMPAGTKALVQGSATVRNLVFDGRTYLLSPVKAWRRTDFGRPQASIRFKMATPIAASVC